MSEQATQIESNETPRVSVLMPMRNAAGYVTAALQSVLAERDILLEVIIIEDGSTDGSVEEANAVGDPRVRIIDGPRNGIAAGYNAGLAEVRGEIVMRCDSDDLYTPGRIARQVAWLDEHPEFAAVCGGFSSVDQKGRLLNWLHENYPEAEITDELRSGETRTHLCTWASRAGLLREAGGCRPFFVTAEDLDLQMRLASAGRVMFFQTDDYHYRLHGTSITHTQPNPQRIFYESTAREFARQRSESGSDDLERGTPPSPPEDGDSKSFEVRGHVQGMLFGRAWQLRREGHWGRAVATGFRAWAQRPMDFSAAKSLLALCIKPAGRVGAQTR